MVSRIGVDNGMDIGLEGVGVFIEAADVIGVGVATPAGTDDTFWLFQQAVVSARSAMNARNVRDVTFFLSFMPSTFVTVLQSVSS